MEKKYFAILVLLIVVISGYTLNNKSIENIRENDKYRFQKFENELKTLKETLERNTSNTDLAYKDIIAQYKKVREAYKAWEYLAEYYAGSFIKEHVNPAPLPKLENNTFGVNILEPKGLQVIDELLYDENPWAHQSEIIKNIEQIIIQLEQVDLPNFYISNVLIASRIELVRIVSLGITGFDTPGSTEENALTDAEHSMKAMLSDYKLLAPTIEENSKNIYEKVISEFESSINYIYENNNFNTFNRYEFINKKINHLYKSILDLHKSLNYEFPEEINKYPTAYNYIAENIFSADFLNAEYYINVPQKFINNDTRKLGKMLFYDPLFSSNNERSCASCHNPKKAFTDNLDKSLAYNFEGKVKRNAPTLINSVYSDRYFHDLRANHLSDQMEHVITNHSEFNTNWNNVIEKLLSCNDYKLMYAKSFQLDSSNSINIQNTQFAMSVYVASITGFNSEFDELIRNSKTTYSNREKRIIKGFNLFMGKAACGTCHFAPLFSGTVPPQFTESESEVLGVSENPTAKKQLLGNDKGRGAAVLKEQVDFYEYSFKTPSIRNIELSFPYMHNGAYQSLTEVMEFYNNGGGAGVGINLVHQTLSTDKLNLTKSEIKDIVLFMESLTDTSNLTSSVTALPISSKAELNKRVVGGRY